jgi:hypothetical protein
VAVARIATGVGTVDLAGEFGGLVQDRVDLVDLVEVVDALQDRGHPLQAHAGVDVLGRAASPRISKPSFAPPVPRMFCMNTRFQTSR